MNLTSHSKDALKIIKQSVNSALQEDIGNGDVTAALFTNNEIANAKVISREDAVLCGKKWFELAFHLLEPDIKIDWTCNEGDLMQANDIVCKLKGKPEKQSLGCDMHKSMPFDVAAGKIIAWVYLMKY